jgi:hypothetical protein
MRGNAIVNIAAAHLQFMLILHLENPLPDMSLLYQRRTFPVLTQIGSLLSITTTKQRLIKGAGTSSPKERTPLRYGDVDELFLPGDAEQCCLSICDQSELIGFYRSRLIN